MAFGFGSGPAGPSFDSGGYVGDGFMPGGVDIGSDFGSPAGSGDFSRAAGMAGAGGGGDMLSFGQGIGLSALSGLFSALGGILAAQEAGRQAIKLKQTPANSSQSIAAAARQRQFAPSTPYSPGQLTSSPQPMLASPDAGRNQMAAALQQKMQGLLTQVGSPQLKASRFGVGGF